MSGRRLLCRTGPRRRQEMAQSVPPLRTSPQVLMTTTTTERCLRCVKCTKALDAGSLSDRDGQPYCKKCYSENFGNEAQGFVLVRSLTFLRQVASADERLIASRLLEPVKSTSCIIDPQAVYTQSLRNTRSVCSAYPSRPTDDATNARTYPVAVVVATGKETESGRLHSALVHSREILQGPGNEQVARSESGRGKGEHGRGTSNRVGTERRRTKGACGGVRCRCF